MLGFNFPLVKVSVCRWPQLMLSFLVDASFLINRPLVKVDASFLGVNLLLIKVDASFLGLNLPLIKIDA